MTDFNIRTDAVDVEQIMRQIRARIHEKRGVDYTEQQIQELANVKLERFLDPKGVRSDLVEQFKRTRDTRLDPFEPQQYAFEDITLYDSHRGIVRFVRRLLNPILKLFFNPNPLIEVLHRQTELNQVYLQQFNVLRHKNQQRDEVDALYYELVHNLVLELTRVSIETRNMKMRLESLSSRMDFDERRARALEGVVQYRPHTGPAREPKPKMSPAPQIPPVPSAGPGTGTSADVSEQQPGEAATGTARRRRRRRRGRRGGRGRGENPNPAELGTQSLSPDGAPNAPVNHSHDSEPDADSDSGEGEEGPEEPSAQ
jgi:hypothetical protein